MTQFESVNSLNFVIETLIVRDGQKLGRMRPDEHGYYNDFPMAVLGIPTRNKTYYKAQEFVKQMTSPDSFFYQLLSDGNLYGEFGHPDLTGLNESQMLERLLKIDEKLKSHHFRKVKSGNTLENGGMLILGDIKPCGPYGEHLRNEIEEPFMNTAFSLRSLAQEAIQNGIRIRDVRKMVTFDYVNAGGYIQAAKRYAAGTESFTDDFCFAINPTDSSVVITEVAMEHFTDTELNDIFKTNKVSKHAVSVTKLTGEGARQLSGFKDKRDAFSALMKL